MKRSTAIIVLDHRVTGPEGAACIGPLASIRASSPHLVHDIGGCTHIGLATVGRGKRPSSSEAAAARPALEPVVSAELLTARGIPGFAAATTETDIPSWFPAPELDLAEPAS